MLCSRTREAMCEVRGGRRRHRHSAVAQTKDCALRALPPTKPGAIHVKSSSSSLVEGALSGADQPPRMRAVGGVQKSFRNVGG